MSDILIDLRHASEDPASCDNRKGYCRQRDRIDRAAAEIRKLRAELAEAMSLLEHEATIDYEKFSERLKALRERVDG